MIWPLPTRCATRLAKKCQKNPHIFLLNLFSPGTIDVAFGAQQQIATFFTSDGTIILDPDGPAGPLFEVPIALPLPEDLGFIP